MVITSESASDTPESEKTGDDKILADAKARLKLVEEAESGIRTLELEDLEFCSGEQWPDSIKADRERDGRPCLTTNRLPQFVQQVTNDQRQNRPSIKTHPVDNGADIETSKVRQGLIRHIEYNSSADVAYDTGFESTVRAGRGAWRVITEYCSPTSFDQDIKIRPIRDPSSVFLDPYSQLPDGSDANWGLIIEDLSSEDFRAKYPKSKLSAHGGWEEISAKSPDWVKQDSARVAEYFYKEWTEKTLILLNDGTSILKEDFENPEKLAKAFPQGLPEGIAVAKERQTQVPAIKWCKLSAVEVLEKTDWLGKYIPIIPIYGTQYYIKGKRKLEGIVRHAKDSQRMLNFWKSAQTEAIALAPRAPFIAAKGQIEGFEADWQNANRKNQSVLEYNPVAVNGAPMPPPQRQAFEPAVQAITQAAGEAADDLKSVTGIYDASLGARSGETSGIAIQRRNTQSQTSNFHFVDNLTRSIKHTGVIINDLIPHIYDTKRTTRILGEEGDDRNVTLNAPFEENGETVQYDMDVGNYDVTVDVGPSFQSKRQEGAQAMLELAKSIPQIGQAAPDLIMKSLDVPGASEMAERLKKTLPPNLVNDDKASKDIPPQVQAQLQQMDGMIKNLTDELHHAHDQMDGKRMELESKERIEFAKIASNETIALAQIDAKDSIALLNSEIAATKHRLDLLNINIPIDDGDEGEQPAPQPQDQAMSHDAGAYPGAENGDGGLTPTGGESPAQSTEGNLE